MKANVYKPSDFAFERIKNDFNQHNCTPQRQMLHTIDKLRNFNVELETCIK